MKKRKKVVFTTSQTAKILNVSKETVINWINKEHLKAFQTIGGHFRIHLKNIIEFADNNNMYIESNWADLLKNKCLVITEKKPDIDFFSHFFSHYITDIELKICTDYVSGCIEYGKFNPTICFIDTELSGCECFELISQIRNVESTNIPYIVMLYNNTNVFSQKQMRQLDISNAIKRPLNEKIIYNGLKDIFRETHLFSTM